MLFIEEAVTDQPARFLDVILIAEEIKDPAIWMQSDDKFFREAVNLSWSLVQGAHFPGMIVDTLTRFERVPYPIVRATAGIRVINCTPSISRSHFWPFAIEVIPLFRIHRR
jgi:hypothetical protein